ncbi:MAG: AbrB/MazE/SpoVT family DNA-binding domain-containing protein [Gammaproteobacteria bacterium]|nr:AbrB/MazE/SpoVT family DNA-binding domain-containing protein [Gammaproteobacteria bacterium]
MATVTVSPKYQVVIPSALRRILGIKPGQKIEVLAYEGRMEFVPVRPMKAMRGFLSGLDTHVPREDDRV